MRKYEEICIFACEFRKLLQTSKFSLGTCLKLIPRHFCIFALDRLKQNSAKSGNLRFFYVRIRGICGGAHICEHDSEFMRKDFPIPPETLANSLIKYKIYLSSVPVMDAETNIQIGSGQGIHSNCAHHLHKSKKSGKGNVHIFE